MILVIEMQCRDWEHNRVNVGFIKLLQKAFPKEIIKLFAEEKHIAGIQELLVEDKKELETASIEFGNWRHEPESHIQHYENIIHSIVKNELNVSKVIFLSCNKGIIKAVHNLSQTYKEKEFFLILHSALEEALEKPSFKQRILRAYTFLRSGEMHLTMKRCLNTCDADNCKYIVYSPCCNRELKGIIKKKNLNNIIFLHHPFYEKKEDFQNGSDKISIGIYGQGVNENARKIISAYNEKYDNGKIIFKIITSKNNLICQERNTERVFEQDYVSNEELESAIQKFDFVLIPYNNNQYRVSASGIFWDAVSQEIPLLMLNSPFFEFYSKYGVGIIKDSIDKMAEGIAKLDISEKEQMIKSERKLKLESIRENVDILREIMK